MAPLRTRSIADEYERHRAGEQSNGGVRLNQGTAGLYRERMFAEDPTRQATVAIAAQTAAEPSAARLHRS